MDETWWHWWFAWRPVICNGRIAWFERVLRKRIHIHIPANEYTKGANFYYWEYR